VPPLETRAMDERPCYSETDQVYKDKINNEVKDLIKLCEQ